MIHLQKGLVKVQTLKAFSYTQILVFTMFIAVMYMMTMEVTAPLKFKQSGKLQSVKSGKYLLSTSGDSRSTDPTTYIGERRFRLQSQWIPATIYDATGANGKNAFDIVNNMSGNERFNLLRQVGDMDGDGYIDRFKVEMSVTDSSGTGVGINNDASTTAVTFFAEHDQKIVLNEPN